MRQERPISQSKAFARHRMKNTLSPIFWKHSVKIYNISCASGVLRINYRKLFLSDLFALHDNTCRHGGSCYFVFRITDTWDGAKVSNKMKYTNFKEGFGNGL